MEELEEAKLDVRAGEGVGDPSIGGTLAEEDP
jgi:hypothetical protein